MRAVYYAPIPRKIHLLTINIQKILLIKSQAINVTVTNLVTAILILLVEDGINYKKITKIVRSFKLN
jgi:hypothetical protein